MKLSSLLISSAALATFASSAYAADAIVIAEPEPVEYVRVCDVYGAGFFYIPGTQNCLRIGGYVRYEANYNNRGWDEGSETRGYRYSNHARFQLNVDARNETEWGTLRSYVEGRFDWHSQTWGGRDLDGSTNSAYLNQAFIELQSGAGTVRLGKTDTAFTRFLGYGIPHGPFDGRYAFNNAAELSYHYDAGNGFSAIIAAVDGRGGGAGTLSSGQFKPSIEGGLRFSQGWGWVGGLVGYSTTRQEWGAKVGIEGNLGFATLGLKGFYASGNSRYSVDSGASEFSVLGYARADLTDTVAALVGAQYFDKKRVADAPRWEITGGLDWRPVNGLRIRPELRYTTEVKTWEAAIRFDRSF